MVGTSVVKLLMHKFCTCIVKGVFWICQTSMIERFEEINSNKLSVIRQKCEFQNGRFKKTNHVKFSEKRAFLTTWYASGDAYQGKINACFLENLTCFVFLKHQFWDLPFCLITDEFLFCETKLENISTVGPNFLNNKVIICCRTH